MKTVILAGGFGTRLSEETYQKPKPLLEIGGMPVLWHIMKIYSAYNFNDFIICCGYKGEMIKEYFSNYFANKSEIMFDNKNNAMEIHSKFGELWNITLVDTGLETMTGGRLKRIKNYLADETFCLTYGDDLKNVNISDLIDFHHRKKTLATVTAVQPAGRFGILKLDNDVVLSIKEKPVHEDQWINGGHYVLDPAVFDYISDDSTVWEREPLEKLALAGQLSAYKYTGLYQPLDTLQDKIRLEELWNTGKAYWKVWK
ncbi:MAG: glucose-1-phosphate cytidylyltransferase [Nitrosotalea sp.]